jgi:hypothetical protein
MGSEETELLEQIERCRRLANFLTDEEMRQALEALAEDYEARLKRRKRGNGFMLRDAGWSE